MAKLIVIDRSVDFVTPMCTPFTYEALIDEFYEIEQNCITLQPDEKNGLQNAKTMKLTKSYDAVYQPLRDLNIKRVVKELEEKRNENK